MVSLKLKITNIHHYLDKQDIDFVYDRTARNGEAGEIIKMKKNILLTIRSAPTTFRLLARRDSHSATNSIWYYTFIGILYP